MNNTLLEDIIKILSKIKKDLPKEKIVPGATLVDDLGLDSLDIVELIIDLEDAYNFDLEEKNAKGISTIQELVDKIQLVLDKQKLSN